MEYTDYLGAFNSFYFKNFKRTGRAGERAVACVFGLKRYKWSFIPSKKKK